MKTLMYPITPEDDFPEMFCAIRPCSGEQQFYAPEGERTNALLSRMHKEAMDMEEAIGTLTDGNQRLRIGNAKLRELLRELYEDQCDDCDRWKYRDRMSELGVEVDG